MWSGPPRQRPAASQAPGRLDSAHPSRNLGVSPASAHLHGLRRPDLCHVACRGAERGFRPRLQALLAVLAGGYRLGTRPIRQLGQDLFGLSISTGMVAKLERSTTE